MFTSGFIMKCLCRCSSCISPFKVIQFKRGISRLQIARGMTLISIDGPLEASRLDVTVRKGDLKLLGTVRPKRNVRWTPPPLCLLGDWLGAPRSIIMKYVQLYLNQKFDVLLLTSKMNHIFYPPRTVQFGVSPNNLARLREPHLHPIMKLLMEERVDSFSGDIYRCLVGQVWDSPCGPDSVARGVPWSLCGERQQFLRVMTRQAVNRYIVFREETLIEAFKGAFAKFKNNKLTCPALCFCSENDPFANRDKILQITKLWRDRTNVKIKSWTKSGHCAHLRDHPEEYKKELADYLEYTGLLKYPERLRSPALPAS